VRSFVTFFLGVFIKKCLSMSPVSVTDVLVTFKSSMAQVVAAIAAEKQRP